MAAGNVEAIWGCPRPLLLRFSLLNGLGSWKVIESNRRTSSRWGLSGQQRLETKSANRLTDRLSLVGAAKAHSWS